MSDTTAKPSRSSTGIDHGWQARLPAEPILEPDLPIVDALHHLYAAAPDFTFEEFSRVTAPGHNIVGSVFVDCRLAYRTEGPAELRSVGETEFVTRISANSRLCTGLIGWADPLLGAAMGPVLDAHLAAGGARFKGIRRSTSWDPDPAISQLPPDMEDIMAFPKFREGLAELTKRGLVFEPVFFHPQLPKMTALARAMPDTIFVVDHIGGLVGVKAYADRDATFPVWRRDMIELGECPNVFMKVGGMGNPRRGFGYSEAADPPSSAQIAATFKPWVEASIEAFGVERCMFESNYPMDAQSYSYANLWNAFKRLTVDYSQSEKTALYSGTAIRAYGLSLK